MKPYEDPNNDKYFFYVKKKYFNLQLKYYKLFVLKHEIPVETLIEALEELRISVRSRNRANLLSNMDSYFQNLIEILTLKTGKKFKKRPRKSNHSYDRWYAEASMDGSLAYNNSADDF